MRKPITFLTAITALALMADLSGCTLVLSGEHGWHGDRGDLVNKDATVRYVGWCDLHPRSAKCAPPSAIVVAESSTAVETTDSGLD